jgi:NAD(P)H-dependent FMN reductase
MKVLVIIGSARKGRTADVVAAATQEALAAHEMEVDLADLAKIDLPFYNEATPPIAAKGEYENKVGAEWAGRVKAADAVVLITPEYNYGTSGIMKNAIDWAYEGWQDKRVAIISYGVDGGSHVQNQLKETMGVLNARVVSDAQATLEFIKSGTKLTEILKHTVGRLLED